MILLGLLAVLLLSAVLLWRASNTEEQLARQRLDTLLGQQAEPSPFLPEATPVPMPQNLPEPGWFEPLFDIPEAASPVSVEEREDRYVIRVPLVSPDDAESVQVSVTPHRIEVFGQTGKKEGGAAITSTFMQSFSTPAELLPDDVQRKTERQGEKTALVITIPKKASPSATPDPPRNVPLPPSAASPTVI